MAGHKTKYKKPKDLEASESKAFLKKQIRKDIKDYIVDKYQGYNPNSVEDKQQNVLRKTDKPFIDDVENMVPSDKDRATYYKVQGDHDPKHTAKERAKLQDEDEKTSKDEIKDKIENLTREQKERLVREYVRRKIKKVLAEKKNAKPDYLDFDKDGDKEEPMTKALKDKEKDQLNSSVVKEQDQKPPEPEGEEETPTPEETPPPPEPEGEEDKKKEKKDDEITRPQDREEEGGEVEGGEVEGGEVEGGEENDAEEEGGEGEEDFSDAKEKKKQDDDEKVADVVASDELQKKKKFLKDALNLKKQTKPMNLTNLLIKFTDDAIEHLSDEQRTDVTKFLAKKFEQKRDNIA